MATMLRGLWKDEGGVATVEYAFLMMLLVVASIAAWDRLSATVGNMVQDATTTIANPPAT